jgi:methionine sulfoxide reductase heme-binding subunit
MNEALWLLGRGTGVAALLLLTLSMGLGVLTAGRYVSKEVPRFALTEIHRRASWRRRSCWACTWCRYGRTPSRSCGRSTSWCRFWAPATRCGGLGTLALDLVAVLVVTSLLRSRMPYGVSRRLHWLSYATWPLAFLHALGSGSDAGTWWLRGGGARVLRRGGGGRRLPPRGPGRGTLDGPARPGQSTGAGGS